MLTAMDHYTSTALESHRAPVHVASVALRVRDIDRVGTFYRDVVGLSVIGDEGRTLTLGKDGVVLLALVEDPQATRPPPGTPGLFHTAFVLPERWHLGAWLGAAARAGWRIDGAADHLVSEAVYLADPEGNGVEIYRDRPRAEWPRDGDRIRMANARLDLHELMALADEPLAQPYGAPSGAGVGHVHLSVANLEEASAVLIDRWGFDDMCRYPGARFLSTGGYHHHIAVNIWNARGKLHRERESAGLESVSLQATDRHAFATLAGRWTAAGGSASADHASIETLGGLRFKLAAPQG